MLAWYRNARIAGRLVTGFSVIAALALVVGGTGLVAVAAVRREADGMYAENVVGLSDVAGLTQRLQERRVLLLRQVLTADPAARAQAETQVAALKPGIDSIMQDYVSSTVREEDRRRTAVLRGAMEAYTLQEARIAALLRENRQAEAQALALGEAGAAGESMGKGLAGLLDLNNQ